MLDSKVLEQFYPSVGMDIALGQSVITAFGMTAASMQATKNPVKQALHRIVFAPQ